MKNKIKFGVSINKVGAFTVRNFRIRTKTGSSLDRLLAIAWEDIDTDPDVRYRRCKTSGDYVIHDFSSIDAYLFENVVYPKVKFRMLQAEVEDLNAKYRALPFEINIKECPLPDEFERTEIEYWDGDESVEL